MASAHLRNCRAYASVALNDARFQGPNVPREAREGALILANITVEKIAAVASVVQRILLDQSEA